MVRKSKNMFFYSSGHSSSSFLVNTGLIYLTKVSLGKFLFIEEASIDKVFTLICASETRRSGKSNKNIECH